jgi:hypothetical protein
MKILEINISIKIMAERLLLANMLIDVICITCTLIVLRPVGALC